MLYIKIMSNEDVPDSCTSKTYRIVQVKDFDGIAFDGNTLDIGDYYGESSRFIVYGNCYVMNESGKTISTYTPKFVNIELNS